ncbi:hypothetical protein L211DRAFT_871497 [Terfezia boudieri ATCC MYA-4762]|uniref:Uncharacterized protein n=1 Tax=Terfezia boudieri ATCC MYA-4762 TaxID=1051890 RepID=A0A3N4L810_9PEZI|nr:hypothetical protein L211DRAFT_871497 [Terfezia boudieri ATCC MYA-4762]
MELSLTLDKERGLDTLNFTGTYPINFYFVTLIEGCESFKKAKLGNEWDARIKQKVIGINLDDAIPKYQATFHEEVMMILRVKRARVDRADRGDEEPGVGIRAGVLICDLIFEGFCEGGLVGIYDAGLGVRFDSVVSDGISDTSREASSECIYIMDSIAIVDTSESSECICIARSMAIGGAACRLGGISPPTARRKGISAPISY